MLILTRNTGRSVKIGDEIEVVVLGVKGNQVRLGINAPTDTPVHREEIYQRIQQELNSPAKPVSNTLATLDETRRYNGVITNLKKERGFGFIYIPGLPDNVFFHVSDLEEYGFEQLEEGAEVKCQVTQNKRGLVAQSIVMGKEV